ncbi:carboxymuconolactone decarboxylase family protein [Nocardioides pelophilus]|uniref:carboxymuconolactone decarboxylase family protein n=1 Tax=Nocardioides pelophilus TaxID=2172019 RepID=UPI001C7E7F29|nr:carboxymuconolactone decarboxylase family protein [Nocardioides pelophilus]
MSQTQPEPDQPLYLDKAEPEVFAAMAGVSKLIAAAAGEAGVSLQLLELVNLRISQINGCAYCLDLHHAKAVRLGEDPRRLAVLQTWQETTLFDDAESAALELAECITRIPEPSVRQEVEDFSRQVLGDAAYAVIAWAAVSMNAFNRISITSHHPVN